MQFLTIFRPVPSSSSNVGGIGIGAGGDKGGASGGADGGVGPGGGGGGAASMDHDGRQNLSEVSHWQKSQKVCQF